MKGKHLSELHIPLQVADAIRALRPELRKKLSLRDIDEMTRPFRERIAELERQLRDSCAESRGLRDAEGIGAGGAVCPLADEYEARIAELEARLADTQQRNGRNIEKLERAENRIAELEEQLYELRWIEHAILSQTKE